MTRLLHYRAGHRALAHLRREGFDLNRIGTLVGPASGPKWLALTGIDRALLDTGLLSPSEQRRLLLAGASAGAWRMLALASGDPKAVHDALIEGYITRTFDRSDTPESISEAYRLLLQELLTPQISHILNHPAADVALHLARARGPLASRHRALLWPGLVAAAGCSIAHRGTLGWFFERCLVHSRPQAFEPEFRGLVRALDANNLLPAALASGSIPLAMASIRDVPGLPRGTWVDGGVADYHLRQPFQQGDRITLFPHYRRQILGVWFDKYRSRRRPTAAALADVLQIYPSQEFFDLLPDQRLPDRDDFVTHMTEPEQRFERWRKVVRASDQLGAELRADIASGELAERVEPLH